MRTSSIETITTKKHAQELVARTIRLIENPSKNVEAFQLGRDGFGNHLDNTFQVILNNGERRIIYKAPCYDREGQVRYFVKKGKDEKLVKILALNFETANSVKKLLSAIREHNSIKYLSTMDIMEKSTKHFFEKIANGINKLKLNFNTLTQLNIKS